MFHSDVLHPLYIGHIVDVSIIVNGGVWDDDGFCVSGGDGHG